MPYPALLEDTHTHTHTQTERERDGERNERKDRFDFPLSLLPSLSTPPSGEEETRQTARTHAHIHNRAVDFSDVRFSE